MLYLEGRIAILEIKIEGRLVKEEDMGESNIFEDLGNFRNFINFKEKEKDKKAENKEPVKLKPSERLLQDIRNNGFDLSQMEGILKTKGNQLIISCAGSGKTTALTFKILYDLKTGWATKVIDVNGSLVRVPEKIWVCTFLRTGAEELQVSLKRWQSKLHCVDASAAMSFSTLHAEFKRALTQAGKAIVLINDSDNTKLLKEVVNGYTLTNAKGKNFTSEDYENLKSALTYTRNRLDKKRYELELYDELKLTPTIIDAILFEWSGKRRNKGVYDFEDLQEVIYTECYVNKNEELIKFISNRYNFIYIDEFQDISQIQYEVLKIYAMGCKQINAIGDDDQTIYSWRGSDNNIILRDFKEDFDPVINKLSVNFRSPSNIINAIKPSILCNVNRFDKDLQSSREGGKVRCIQSVSYTSMLSSMCEQIEEDISNRRSVAVLCRVNSDGLLPALLFDKMGNFSFSISGDGMTLDSYMGRMVLNIVKLFTENSSPAVSSSLKQLTWDSGVNYLINAFKSTKGLSIWNIDSKDLYYSCPQIADRIMSWRNVAESRSIKEAILYVLQDYRVNVFAKDTKFNTLVKSIIQSVETLFDYLDYDCAEDYLFELEDINERLKARKKKSGVNVRIATVHEFKGKEADSVYVWNDSKEVFPVKGSDGEMSLLEEERRIHYIACTRAREISTLVYKKGSPGMFVSEMDLDGAEVIKTGGDTLKGSIVSSLEEDRNLKRFGIIATSKEEAMNSFSYEDYTGNEFWGEYDGV